MIYGIKDVLENHCLCDSDVLGSHSRQCESLESFADCCLIDVATSSAMNAWRESSEGEDIEVGFDDKELLAEWDTVYCVYKLDEQERCQDRIPVEEVIEDAYLSWLWQSDSLI